MAKEESNIKTAKAALIGADTLLGREVQEVLESRKSGVSISAFGANGEGNFGEQEGEAVYFEPLETRTVEDCDVLIVAGSEAGALKAYEIAKAGGGRHSVIDCTGYLDQAPEARISAPIVETPGPDTSWLLVMAHPAASALALVLTRLSRHRQMRRAIAHVFEPASERGKRGLTELHQQVSALLSFKPLETSIFDAQLGFNLLAQYGEDAPEKLAAFEQRIERHTAALLSRLSNGVPVPMPSLRLIQAPVFHGYSISLWAEFEAEVRPADLEQALASAQIEIRAADEEAPHSAGAVSQSGLIAGDIRADPNHSRAGWFWIVGDNLRLTADAAADSIAGLKRR
ncbi:MAG TPA: Asd/ArgC dimerization domain-containing protein [Bryobacteraceae bacterium]